MKILMLVAVLAFVGAVQFSFGEEEIPCSVLMQPGCPLFPNGVGEFLKEIFENRKTPTLDEVCQGRLAHIVYLNHTIVNGTINGICSDGPEQFHISLEANDNGYFTIDIPKDVFNNNAIFDCDRGFPIDVYSSKYVTYDMYHMVHREYIPTNATDSCILRPNCDLDITIRECLGDWSAEFVKVVPACNDPTFTFRECFERTNQQTFDNMDENTRPLVVTKIKSTDTFDRYKFPFLADDLFFSTHVVSPDEVYPDPMPYNPGKYTTPLPSNTSSIPENQNTGNQDTDSFCNSEFVPIVKPGGSTACVKPSTFEKLILRGWSEANPQN